MQLSARIEALPLAEPFVISRSTTEVAEVVWVELEHDGVTGYGEAAPIDRYEESPQSALSYLESLDSLGDDPLALEEIPAGLPAGEYAARGALDAALHDLCGKLVGLPVWRFLGLPREGPPSSWTIGLGDPEEMARKADQVTDFKSLKLKLGGRDGRDVERVRAVRDVWPGPIRVDVNEAWADEAESLEQLAELAGLGVEYCEQPLPAGHPGGARLKAESPIPIFVDEDCHTLADVAACAERAHGINVKLAKSGGIREAIRMVHAARALDLEVMLGCMVESGLGIAAGASIASLFDHVDLDGNILLREDPWPGVQLVDGVQLPAEGPGLGVTEAVPSSS